MSNELSTKTYNNFKNIVLNESPLIDVRAPIEFQKGAFINAVNLPLMSDDERHRVGTVYKKNGHEAAVALGHELVTGAVRAERINAWTHYMAHYPDAMLYCFRGGLRSELSQEWLSEALGRDVLRLEGGYKAFRQYLLEALEPSAQTSEPIMLGGHTGSGKTILLKRFKSFIDLEGIANHRGSSFGNHITPQPSQISFDNNLAYGLIQHREAGYRYMLLENEDRNVGRCFMPRPLVDHFNTGRLIILEESLETRTQITKLEYVREAQEEHMQALGLDDGMTSWANYIRGSINRL
ncbi:MAG: tRNA 2-selenouridine(34) synthase MnmH [Vallitaleaceae bacterium]|jgi:tRNA 2-selenouridine synthase|nr:tRNA 2-selenouridine(34) synthase MnmH [Vallitaleaceae bacterium]